MTDTEFVVPTQYGTHQGRTPDQFNRLLADLQAHPGEWAIYSRHNRTITAAGRANVLRRKRTPKALQPHMDHIEFRSNGSNVLIRWTGTTDAAE